MSVESSKIIDAMSLNSKGKVELTISDHLIWDLRNQHLIILQDKINSYLEFIESGEVYDKFPKAVGREFIIRIALKYFPDKSGEEFLIRVGALLYESGYDFGYYLVKEES